MEEKKENLHLRIDKSLKDEIRQLAKDNHLTVSSFIKVILNDKIKESKKA